MKLYYCFFQHNSDFYECNALFENGWVAFGHICSTPAYAFGDLWRNRPDRQKIIKKMGIEVEDTGELINDITIEKTHPGLFAKFKECDQDYWNKLYKSFEETKE